MGNFNLGIGKMSVIPENLGNSESGTSENLCIMSKSRLTLWLGIRASRPLRRPLRRAKCSCKTYEQVASPRAFTWRPLCTFDENGGKNVQQLQRDFCLKAFIRKAFRWWWLDVCLFARSLVCPNSCLTDAFRSFYSFSRKERGTKGRSFVCAAQNPLLWNWCWLKLLLL